jgi:hypothetical protein
MAKDGLSADSLERTENLTPPDDSRNLAYLLSSNLIGEVPMPHTNGWQTVPLAEVPRSAPKVDLQGTHQPDGAKVKAIVAESSPGPVNSEPPVRPSAEPGLSTRVIRLKKPNVRYRSSAGLTSAEVKMRLIALWHQSLVRTKESRRWTVFSNLNRGERKKAAFIARTGP